MNFGPDMGGPLIAKEGDDENPGWIEEAGVSAEQLAGVRHVADRFGEDDGVEALVELQLLHIGDEVANAVIGDRTPAETDTTAPTSATLVMSFLNMKFPFRGQDDGDSGIA